MPDDIVLGSDTFATDNIGGVNYQRVKLTIGADGTATDVSGSNPIPVTGALTDTQLRASAVPVSGPLTDTQLRATAVPVSASALPLPSGAATAANQSTGNTSLANIDTDLGAVADSAASSDTGSFSLIALVKRGLTNWTTLLGRIPSLVSGRIPVDGSGVTQPVSGTVGVSGTVTVSGPLTDTQLRASAVPVSASSLPLPTGAATETTLSALNTKIPASPATEGGNLATLVARTPALGSAVSASSTPVVIASDQGTVAVNQAGVSASGSITALNANLTTGVATTNSTVALSLTGSSGVTIDLRGTFTATITFQGTTDGSTWTALPAIPVGSGVNIASVTTATAAGSWMINANGMQQVRATCSAYTSGTVTAVVRAMQATGLVYTMPAGQTTQAVSGTVTANVTGYPTAAASADALANPTVTKIDTTGLLFNGTSWDRYRNNIIVTAEASSAKTATGNGTTQTNFNHAGVFLWVNVTAVSGTTPTLTVRLQWSPDGGTTWVDLDTTNAQTASITGVTTAVLRVYPGLATTANASLNSVLPRTWRLAWTIGGTTPSFTFAVQANYVL